jgi:signal transduction histidine kinase
MVNSLSGRLLLLTALFVMVAEIMIFVPSVARFREDYLLARLERAQIASLTLLSNEMISPEIEAELLKNAEVLNVVLRRDAARQLVLSSPILRPVSETYDLRNSSAAILIRDALLRLARSEPEVIRVLGAPVYEAGMLIEFTMDSTQLRNAMLDYGLRIFALSAVISGITAFLLFLAARRLLVRPIKGVIGHMQRYAAAPEDTRRVIEPSASVIELREAEETLRQLQTELTSALRQKERLAQLGGAVSKISHDLRNILTSAQLFTDRIESSDDPLVIRMAPKLVTSISRAVHLCESTLAFGKAEEPAPRLSIFPLAQLVSDVLEGEQLAAEGSVLEFSANIPPALMIRADSDQLFRVLSNLVRNARHAIIASGDPGLISITALETNDAWRIEVADTGPGLPPRALKHLFTPFQGGVAKGGTGLGLAISAELIRGHGGELSLAQTGENGTRFCITLPKGVEGLED